ncbi:MAG: tetratricopeptide repeat protein, partial [Gammaproteobacteria bacterium]|nr:tetratricopeptide repeat protein [Gammaproteobacteria bacterium]
MAADKGQARIYIGQGMLLMERGRLDEAEARFVRALQVDPRNAEANFRIGHAHLLRNNLEKALDYMLQATGFEPENTLYAMNVAQIYERMNNLEEAIKEYERIINVSNEEKVRKTAEKRMTLASGRLMAQKGEVNAALLLFNGLLLEYPEDVKVLQNIALAYLNLKRTEEAEQILKKLERITPNDVQLQMQLANLYEGEGKIDRAVVHLQKFINVQKRGPQVKSTMLRMTMLEGDIAMNKEDWDGAVKIFSRAINLDSRFVKAYFTRGSAYALAGKKKEALKDFDVVLKLDPDNLNVRINISNIYIEQKEFDKAKVLLDYVISNDRSGYFEKSAKARLNYMHTVVADEALKAGNVEESFKEYEKALEFYSGNVKANFNRGLILVNQGKLEEAEKEFLSVIEAMPESTGARINLANIYSSMSRFSEEVEQYRAVVKLDKNSKDGKQASDRLPLAEGRALMADGKIAEAEAMFLEIVKQTRFDVRAFFFLGNISSRRGDLRKAAEYYQKLLNFMPGNHNVRMALAEVYELLGFEELAANEYRGVLFTSRNASLAESAKLRLENVESKLSGFTRTMSYQMVYIDNYNQNDEEPLEEYSSSLSFNVGFVHKFAQEFTMGLRAVPSYSNLHNSGADFLSLNLNGDLRIGNTQRDWFFSL